MTVHFLADYRRNAPAKAADAAATVAVLPLLGLLLLWAASAAVIEHFWSER